MIDEEKLLLNKILLRPDEAAKILRISRRQIYYLIDTGDISAVEIGGMKRIKTESIRKILSAKESEL